MTGIEGRYPGGPRRKAGESDGVGGHRPPGPARLDCAEDIEARIVEEAAAQERARRRKRVAVGMATAAILAAGVGIFVGYRAYKSSEALTAERNEAARGKTGVFDPTFQTNRVLDELWKMEIKQRQPGPP